jgi:hypothetical protein
MGYMIEISESKKEKLSEHIEKALHEMGKAMAICEQFGSMGERQGDGSYGNRYDDMGERGRYGMRGGYGMRDDEDWDEDEMMGERRRRSRRTGRYM